MDGLGGRVGAEHIPVTSPDGSRSSLGENGRTSWTATAGHGSFRGWTRLARGRVLPPATALCPGPGPSLPRSNHPWTGPTDSLGGASKQGLRNTDPGAPRAYVRARNVGYVSHPSMPYIPCFAVRPHLLDTDAALECGAPSVQSG